VSIAERNVVRLVALINDILDLERLQTGKVPMHLAHTLVADLFVRSVEAVRGFADPAGVAIDSKPTLENAFVDSDRITQVLVNLLSNAVKFSPRGSTVFLSAAAAGSMVEIRVTDQGRGIPRPLQQAVFERFRQVKASDSREKGGTGLGLAICKAIVEQHGGTVGVESEEGRGSSFWMRLPASRKRVSLMSDPHGLRGTALLVDDDEELLGVLSRQLARDGVSILTAATGPEALRLLREEKPGVMVLDLGLPVGDGFQVVEAMRREPALASTQVLIYTGRDLDEEDRTRLRLTPTTRFLTKAKASDDDVRSAVLELLRPTSGLWKRT
jgi:CheY-like chemotaxis protein/anti-sigma regulatory factor (Ser/Thr protein kinase)